MLDLIFNNLKQIKTYNLLRILVSCEFINVYKINSVFMFKFIIIVNNTIIPKNFNTHKSGMVSVC